MRLNVCLATCAGMKMTTFRSRPQKVLHVELSRHSHVGRNSIDRDVNVTYAHTLRPQEFSRLAVNPSAIQYSVRLSLLETAFCGFYLRRVVLITQKLLGSVQSVPCSGRGLKWRRGEKNRCLRAHLSCCISIQKLLDRASC